MSETKEKQAWIETLPKPTSSQLIFIRHGESKYIGNGTDLTRRGVSQIKDTAVSLKTYLGNFDRVLIVTSPFPRALSSATVFAETLGLNLEDIKKSGSLGGVAIKNSEEFWKYMKSNPAKYEEIWIDDPFLAQENPLAESKELVDKRAARFLYHYGRTVDKIAKVRNIKIGLVAFTHTEVGLNYLKGTPLLNGEPIMIDLTEVSKSIYTVYARGSSNKIKQDENGRLILA